MYADVNDHETVHFVYCLPESQCPLMKGILRRQHIIIR